MRVSHYLVIQYLEVKISVRSFQKPRKLYCLVSRIFQEEKHLFLCVLNLIKRISAIKKQQQNIS